MFKPLCAALVAIAFTATALAADGPPAPRKERVSFPKGKSETTIKGALKGGNDVDYLVRAAAGQTLEVELAGSNSMNDFNVLPPGSKDAAMFVSSQADAPRFKVVLPTDGDYAIRVYLGRAAARRKEASNFTLKVSVTGEALKPLSAKRDAKVAGTSYHATAQIPCKPPFASAAETCEAGVIRRGTDGTATLQAVGKSKLKRSVLLVKGSAVSSDAMDKVSSAKQGDLITITIGDERYEVREAFLNGG